MKNLTTAAALYAMVLCGCNTAKGEARGEEEDPKSKSGSSSESAKADSKPKLQTGGALRVKFDDEQADMKIGPAFASVKELSDGTLYLEVRALNDGVKDASCATVLDGDKAVGGTNWAVEVSSDRTLQPGSVTVDEAASATIHLVHSKGPRKGEANGWRPFGAGSVKRVEIKKLDERSVTLTAKFDSGEQKNVVEGEITATMCAWEKREAEAE